MENNNYVVLVHDRRDGTYAFRGEGTQLEIVRDVRCLVEEKKIPPRRIEVVPVKGEPRIVQTKADSSTKVGVIIGISASALAIGGLIYYGIKKYKEKKKKEKK